MAEIVWNKEPIVDLIFQQGYEFARIATPRGWRTSGKKTIVPLLKGKTKLEGNCFGVSLLLGCSMPESFYYCEGYAAGHPHAWLCPKRFKGEELDTDWAIDLTWPYYHKSKQTGQRVVHDKHFYLGVKFDPVAARDFLVERGKAHSGTSVSMLKYWEEVQHLIVKTDR